MIIQKRSDIHTLTDLRTIIAMKWYNIKVRGSRANLSRILSSKLSWQDRIQWMRNINEYEGKIGENIGWLSVIHNSEDVALEKLKGKAERVSGDKNPFYNHGGKLSPFSKKSHFYNADLSKKINDKLSIEKNRTTNLEYWLNKGYDIDEAKEKLTNRQRTFTKEKCVLKYGDSKGKEIWKRRQDKWQETLNNKPEDERARINSLKCGKGYAVSKSEKELIKLLSELFPSIESGYSIFYDNGKKYYVYDIRLGNKIIEYNGDFWHANPENI